MQENNFEKQVQDKLDELRIDPSGAVWQKVVLRIEKRKRSWRVLVLLLCLVALTTAGLTWWNIASSNYENKKVLAGQHKDAAPGDRINDDNKTNGGSGAESKRSIKELAASTTTAAPVDSIVSGNEKLSGASTELIRSTATAKSGDKKLNKENAYPETGKNRKKKKSTFLYSKATKTATEIINGEAAEPEENIPSVDALKQAEQPGMISKQLDTAYLLLTPQVTNNDNPIASTDSILIDQPKSELAETNNIVPTPSSPKISKHPRWQFGVNFSAGASTTSNGYLGIVGINSSDENKAYVNSPATGSNGSGNSNNSVGGTPSPVKAGKAVLVGIFTQKQLSKKISFQTGLNYKYYTTKMALGSRVDSFSNLSNSSFYFRIGNRESYTNRYHFIEMPMGLQWRISGQKKLPLYLYAGVSISRLINTNALQYDASGIYYTDQSVFKKTQIDLTTRILIALSKTKKNALLLGPDLNFSLGKMAGSGLYKSRNYNYLGIHLQKPIGK